MSRLHLSTFYKPSYRSLCSWTKYYFKMGIIEINCHMTPYNLLDGSLPVTSI